MAYITQAEFEFAIPHQVLVAYLDDDHDGLVEDATMTAFISRASALVDAVIAPVYSGPFPITQTPVPALIRELTIQYCEALVFERRPELARSDDTDEAKGRWKRAEGMGDRLQKAILRIPDLTQAGPANVGGVSIVTTNAIITSASDGTPEMGDF